MVCADRDHHSLAKVSFLFHCSPTPKLWLAISEDGQYRFFKAREHVSFKRFKITEEDWWNRKRWDAYKGAVCDMVDLTSRETAPWTLVVDNNRYFARIKVLKATCHEIEAALARVDAG